MKPLFQDFSTTRRLILKQGDHPDPKIAYSRNVAQGMKGGLYFQEWYKANDPEYPLVSVLTVQRNETAALEETIQSVLHQDYPNIEYIIVDGNSSGATLEMIRRYEDFIDLWVSEPDAGFYDGLNKGILLSGGEYVNVLNAGDLYMDKKTVSRFVNAFREKQTDLVYSDALLFDKETGGGWIRYSQLTRFHLANGGVPQQSFFYRRNLFDRIGLFDTNFPVAADLEFLLRALLRYRVTKYYLNGPLILFATGGAASIQNPEEPQRVRRKHFSAWELRLFQRNWFKRLFRSTDVYYRIGFVEWCVRKLFGIWEIR